MRQEDRRVPPCSGRPSASVGGGGGGRRTPRRRRALLRRTAVRVVEGLIGESCGDQIEEGVRILVARGGYRRDLGAGDGLIGANRAGGRGGSGRPESGEETSSRSSCWPGGVLERCRDGACSRASSRPLFIGGPRRWQRTGFSGEVYGGAGHWSGRIRGRAPSWGFNGSV